jgi:DNA-binding NarL/FixJ family response regulator
MRRSAVSLYGASTTRGVPDHRGGRWVGGRQKAEALQPDLILLDINLPKLHGFEVAKQVRSLVPDARLLFMSQESSPDIVRKALSLGAQGYIQKLSAETDLLPAIDAALGGQRFVSSSLAFTEPADAPAPHRHEILFCSDDAAVVDGFTRFIAAALSAAMRRSPW